MAEGGISSEMPVKKGKVTRRDFLKLSSLALGAAASVPLVRWGIEHWSGIEEFFAKLDIVEDIRKGKFNLEKISINSLQELKQRILDGMKSLDGISEGQVYLSDDKEKEFLRYNTESEMFLPASIIKILVCNEAWKMGIRDEKNYLTPEIAEKILRYSDVFDDLVMKLPIANGRSVDELEQVVSDILKQAGVPPKNDLGKLPLKVNMNDLFDYLYELDMPEVMKNAMKQRPEDFEENYGVAKVLLDNLRGIYPSYFKIGLILDRTTDPPEIVNSYYFQIGKQIKALGYSKGNDLADVHR